MKLIENKLYQSDLKKALSQIDTNEFNNKTVLVTGGLGLIGSSIVDLLLLSGKIKKIGVACRNIDKYNSRYKGIKCVEFVEYDALKNLELQFVPDYIIHSAGAASPELYVNSPVETILSNFNGMLNLLEYAKENNVRRLLYISSSEVYGKKENKNSFTEDSYGLINLDDIRSSYPVAKRASEMLCKSYNSEYGVDCVIVRPGHIYGPSASESDRRASSEFAYKAAKGQNIELKSAGLQKRSYCYSVECAIQILFALLKGESGLSYNISNNEVTSIRQMAENFARAGNVDIVGVKPTEEEINAFNPMDNSTLNNDKIKKLGYNDIFSVEESMRHTVQIIKECMLG